MKAHEYIGPAHWDAASDDLMVFGELTMELNEPPDASKLWSILGSWE